MNGIKSMTTVAALVVAAMAGTTSAHSWSFHDHAVCQRSAPSPYQRGHWAGRRAGWRKGIEDGRYGRTCVSRPHVRRKHRSRQYIAGYKKGYVDAYELGYQRGKRFRRRRRWYW